jgi:tetratricopeptide (TPR) repeat protein
MNDLVRTANKAPIDWGNKNYLIVDDFAGIRQLLRESLRSIGAKHVDQASGGGEAIALLQRTRYDVILCDYNLDEGKNGQQVLEEARMNNLVMPSAMWIMVSAEKSVESVMGAAEHQPDAYLIKPITEGVLLTRLNRIWVKKMVFRQIDQAYAEKDYLLAAKLCDEQITNNKVHEIDLLRMKAHLLLKAGEPELARKVYERILLERDYDWAKVGLAKIRMLDGDVEAARQMFQNVIADNRFYLDAYDQLATAYTRLGQSDEACNVLERATKMSPNSISRQRNLGEVAFKLGNVQMAEKAFRKCISIGEHSALKTADAYFGLARVFGMKNDPKEALALLATAQKEFGGEMTGLRAKITEGLVYHESGDYRRARKSGDELESLLQTTADRPDTRTCLDMATLLFAVGVKEAPVDLLCYVIKNNHDNAPLMEEVQAMFNKARMGDEGNVLIMSSRKEAGDIMNKGVLLWKTGKLMEAVEWMREARAQLPNNLRILFNAAQILITYLQKNGFDQALSNEASEVLAHVDKISPNQQRFAVLMEQLAALAPGGKQVEAASEGEAEAPAETAAQAEPAAPADE